MHVLSLFFPTLGHVRLTQDAGTTPGLRIRNAASANGDGVFSVAGACGGNAAFGANGVTTTIASGAALNLKVNYNGGHASAANAFKVAFMCAGNGADLTQNLMETAGAKTTCATVAAPGGSNGSPYTVQCTLPTTGHGITGAAGQPCTISILDQRDWGGCIDLNLAAAAGGGGGGAAPSLPPTLPPSTGKKLSVAGDMIENAPGNGPSCRRFLGISLSLNSPSQVGDKQLTYSLCGEGFATGTGVVTLKQVGIAYRGTILSVGGEPFEVSVDPSTDTTSLTNVVAASPTICDFIAIPSTSCGQVGRPACVAYPSGNGDQCPTVAAANAAKQTGALAGAEVVTVIAIAAAVIVVGVLVLVGVVVLMFILQRSRKGSESDDGSYANDDREMSSRAAPPTGARRGGPPPKPSKRGGGGGGAPTCVALHSYAGQDDDELTFTKGDTIVIITKDCPAAGEGWWKGSVDGVDGLFPNNYVSSGSGVV